MLAILSCGCTSPWQETRPIRELRIVETLGCDRKDDGVTLSAYAAQPELKLRQTAPSIRLAMDQMRNQAASPALFFAHTEFLLLGQALAEDGLAPVLDLVGRSQDMRLHTPIFILYGGDAADAVELGEDEQNITQMLAALREDTDGQGACHAFSCGEILRALSERGAALAAACTIDGEHLKPHGYAILKAGVCVGWVSAPADQAVGLLMGLRERGDVRVKNTTLTLENCKAKITPRWNGDTLAGLDIALSLRAALTETAGQPGTTQAETRAELEKALAETVAAWVETLLRQSQALEADFLGLGGGIAAQSPGKWAGIQAEWNAIFPTLPWRVTVAATLDRTQDLEEPLNLGGTP